MFEQEKKVLEVAISNMEIPSDRQDVEVIENIRWMKRNLGVENSGHRHFEQAMKIITTILQDENK